MAKLTGAKKKAFLERMAKGRENAIRAKYRRRPLNEKSLSLKTLKVGRRRARRSKGDISLAQALGVSATELRRRERTPAFQSALSELRSQTRTRRVNPMEALIANPAEPKTAKRKRRMAKLTGAKKTAFLSRMAKGRRRKGKGKTRRTVKRRRRTASTAPLTLKRRRRSRRSSGIARVNRHARVIYINPKKSRSRRNRRRNGSGGLTGALKSAFTPYLSGVVASGVAAILDTALSKNPVAAQLVKVVGVVGVAYLGRRHPSAAAGAIGAIGATQGYALVTKLAGGMIARTPAQAVKGLGEMAANSPEIGALLQGGLGALLQDADDGMGDPTVVQDIAHNYASALDNMSEGDDGDDY